MPLVRALLPKALRRLIYALLAGSVLTGSAFFLLSRFIEIEGEFGPQKHPWQAPLLAIHGAFAFLMLMVIGAMWLNHVPVGWRSGRSRKLGVTLVSLTALLAISGWLLYYAAGDEWRSLLGNLHFAIGLSLPLMLVLHVSLGRRARGARGSAGAVLRRKLAPGGPRRPRAVGENEPRVEADVG